MMATSLHDAIANACAAVGIRPPKRTAIGRWLTCDTFARNGRGDGRVKIDDNGRTGVAWNHQTGQRVQFRMDGKRLSATEQKEIKRLTDKRRREDAEKRATAAKAAEAIVRAARPDRHPYLVAKGFPDERMLTIEDPGRFIPEGPIGDAMRRALPERGPKDGPYLIVPCRPHSRLTSLQIIAPDGIKKNLLFGSMSGVFCRLTKGKEFWACEGVATGLSVRNALGFLGRSMTVLVGFSAENTAKVARRHNASIAADHDKPVDIFNGLGTGEHFARQSGCRWVMPPDRGDFNDMHQRVGLRAVAMRLREGIMR